MPVVYNEASSGDTTHATRPTLSYSSAGSTVIGTLDHYFDPTYGFTSDLDYYQFMLGDGPGEIARGSYLTVTFYPPGAANYFTDYYSAAVTFRIDTDENLDSTAYYPGSNGTAIRHDSANPNGPFTVTFQIPTEAEVAGNAIEFVISGYSNSSLGDLYYEVTFGGPPTGVDLSIPQASVLYSTIENGDNAIVSFKIANAGTETAIAPQYGIFLSTNATYDAGDILLESGNIRDLAPNDDHPRFRSVPLPGNLVSGTFYIIVVADPDGAINESTETNNYYVIPITVTDGIPQGSDLYIGGTEDNQAFDIQTSTTNAIVNSGGGSDYIRDGSGSSVLYAGLGRDVVLGGDGADMMFGDTDILGDDDASGPAGSADQLIGGLGADFIYAGAGGDYVNGEGGDDAIFGQAGDDLAYGGAGHDRMYGGLGNDQMWGGTETTLRSNWFGSPITVNYNGVSGSSMTSQQYSVSGVAQTTGTGNDYMDGGAGNDRLEGQDGNDTLIGDTGVDTLLGGDGDDTIIWDAADDLANVLGGNGTDTLLVIQQAAPTTFNLATHGFERANVVTEDVGENWWQQISDYYNASWQRTNSDTFADDGRTIQTTYDVSAGGTGVNWQYITDYRNASNVLTNQDGVFDNGTTFAKTYDYAAGTATDGVDDWLSEYTYFFRNVTDQQLGKVLNVEGFADDGRKFTQTNDVDGTQAWNYQTNWYENDGVTLDFLEIRWDNGTTQIIPY